MTAQQRADIANGVWLCRTCAKKVDNDQIRFNAAVLKHWTAVAEQAALDEVAKTSRRRDGVQIADKWVNLSYPEEAGITQKLTPDGYDLSWSTANHESAREEIAGSRPPTPCRTYSASTRNREHRRR